MRREPRAKPPAPAVRPAPPASLGEQLVALLTAFLEGQREMGRKLDLPLADPRDDAPTVHQPGCRAPAPRLSGAGFPLVV